MEFYFTFSFSSSSFYFSLLYDGKKHNVSFFLHILQIYIYVFMLSKTICWLASLLPGFFSLIIWSVSKTITSKQKNTWLYKAIKPSYFFLYHMITINIGRSSIIWSLKKQSIFFALCSHTHKAGVCLYKFFIY
jgi:hypothetical protein